MLRPKIGILRQTLRHEQIDTGGNVGSQLSQRLRYGPDVGRDELMRREIMEGRLPGEQLVGQTPERV
jgi:hypothetical protein